MTALMCASKYVATGSNIESTATVDLQSKDSYDNISRRYNRFCRINGSSALMYTCQFQNTTSNNLDIPIQITN